MPTQLAPLRALRRRRHWLWLTCAVVVLGIVGFTLGRPTEPECPLVLDPDSTDFGEVWAQREFPWTLKVKNVGSEDIDVEAIKASCRCTSFEPRSFVVPAGGTVPVRFTLNLWPRTTDDAVDAVDSYATQFVPVLRDATFRGQPWTLQGRVRPCPISVRPSAVDFGETLVRGWRFSPKGVQVEWREPVARVAATCDEPFVAVRIVGTEPNCLRCNLELLPTPDLRSGDHRFSVKIRGIVAPGGGLPSDAPEFPLDVSASVREDVYASPKSVSFGVLPLGAVAYETVSFHSIHNEPFRIDAAKDGGPGPIEIRRVDNGGDPSPAFRISAKSASAGAQPHEARFVVVQRDRSYQVAVPVSYHGLPEQPIAR